MEEELNINKKVTESYLKNFKLLLQNITLKMLKCHFNNITFKIFVDVY